MRRSGIEHFRSERRTAHEKVAALYARAAKPYLLKRNPEQPIETLQARPGLLPLKYGELLSESS
jgi:hypothetical protein